MPTIKSNHSPLFWRGVGGGGFIAQGITLGEWKIPTEHANLSEKDTKHAMLKDFDSPFDIHIDLYGHE